MLKVFPIQGWESCCGQEKSMPTHQVNKIIFASEVAYTVGAPSKAGSGTWGGASDCPGAHE